MRPKYLHIQNIGSHIDTVIPEFESGITLFYGTRGAGKSIMLEAIVYALYAKNPRASKKGDIDLFIRDPKKDLIVEYQFEHRGQEYRVVRKRLVKGTSAVQLYVKAGDHWMDISGAGVEDTNKKLVNEILGIPYEAFVSLIFSAQFGEDSLTRQTSGDAAEIVGSFLGSQPLTKISNQAKEVSAAYSQELDRLNSNIGQNRTLAVAHDDIEKELKQSEATLSEKNKDLAKEEGSLEKLREINSMYAEVSRLLKEFNDADRKLKEYKAVSEREEEILTKIKQREGHVKRKVELQTLRGEWEGVRGEISAHRLAEDSREKEYARKREELAKRAAPLEEKYANFEAISEMDIGLARQTANTRREDVISHITTKDALISELGGTIKLLKNNLAEVSERLSGDINACPLCQSPLDAVRRGTVVDDLNAQISKKEAKRQEIIEEKSGLEGKAREIDEHLTYLAALEEYRSLSALRAEIKKLDDEGQEAEDVFNKRLGDLEKELEKIKYDESELVAIEKAVTELEEYVSLRAKLDVAKKEIEELASKKLSVQTEGAAVKEKIKAVTGEETPIEPQKAKQLLDEKTAKIAALKNEVSAYNRRIGELNNQLATAKEAKKVVGTFDQEIKRLEREIKYYDGLCALFGKNGPIQRKILQDNVPYIQERANEILGEITDGQTSFEFKFEKELKSGATRDSFEIIVNREGEVPRQFVSFSGGERTELDIALQFACMMVMGVPFCVKDEGFGTLDQGSLRKTLGALSAAAKKMPNAVILFVSHVEEMLQTFENVVRFRKDAGVTVLD